MSKLRRLLLLGVLVVVVTLVVTVTIILAAYSGTNGLLSTFRGTMHRHVAPNRPIADVVVTCTTMPGNFDALQRTLHSVLALDPRPREIYVNVPDVCVRTGETYVTPDWLRNGPFILLPDVVDTGPSTKYLPTLRHLQARNRTDQLVLVIDDDCILSEPTLLATLVQFGDVYPQAALTYGGKRIPREQHERNEYHFDLVQSVYSQPSWRSLFQKHGMTQDRIYVEGEVEPVDVIMGHSTYLLRPRFLDLARLGDYSAMPREARFVDDIVLSGCLAERGVPRLVVRGWPEPRKQLSVVCRDLAHEVLQIKSSYVALHNGVNRTTHNDDTMMTYFGPRVWTRRLNQ